jgi:YibE/F-like protein
MRIGRDHVASTVNTLLLAYAGASMPLLILFVLSGQPASTVASTELVATEIVRTLVGSLGLVASVPITTWLAVGRTTRRGRHARTEPQPIDIPDPDGPEEHPIPEHRRDVWTAWLRAQRERRFRA